MNQASGITAHASALAPLLATALRGSAVTSVVVHSPVSTVFPSPVGSSASRLCCHPQALQPQSCLSSCNAAHKVNASHSLATGLSAGGRTELLCLGCSAHACCSFTFCYCHSAADSLSCSRSSRSLVVTSNFWKVNDPSFSVSYSSRGYPRQGCLGP